MPLTYFKCQQGLIPIEKCLEKCPSPRGRCLSLPTLYSIGQTRIWTGTPSTTQLLNPTRMEYLQITKPFAIDPFDQAFALLGTRHHQMLESVANKFTGLDAEKRLTGEVSGIVDLLEPVNGGNEYRLIDYKTFGSYVVAKLLDIKKNGDYDKLKLQLQLNNYRLLAFPIGFNIVELMAQITVRDGGTFTAKNNGINKNIYLLPVPIMPDDEVTEYFLTKSYALITALNDNILPSLCDYEERWGGRRCKGFCNVAQYCPEGAKVNKIKLEI